MLHEIRTVLKRILQGKDTFNPQACGSLRHGSQSVFDLNQLPARREHGKGIADKERSEWLQHEMYRIYLYAPPSALAMMNKRDGKY